MALELRACRGNFKSQQPGPPGAEHATLLRPEATQKGVESPARHCPADTGPSQRLKSPARAPGAAVWPSGEALGVAGTPGPGHRVLIPGPQTRASSPPGGWQCPQMLLVATADRGATGISWVEVRGTAAKHPAPHKAPHTEQRTVSPKCQGPGAEAEKFGLNPRFRPGNTNKPFSRPSRATDKNHMAWPAPFPRGSLSDHCLYLSDRTQSPLRWHRS